jgi:hypothetical protein
MGRIEPTMRKRTWISTSVLVLCIGVAGLLCEHFELSHPFVPGMHVLFGCTTLAVISAVLFAGARRLADQPALELYSYTRLVSRWVYILLYVLGIVRVCLYLLDVNHGQVGPSMHPLPLRPPDDFYFYVTCFITPLWVMRALVLTAPPRLFGEAR